MEQPTEQLLNLVVASHILKHEERVALAAVDRARLQCQEINCAIGKRNYYTAVKGELTLTDFDKSLLAGMKIAVE